MYGGYKGTGLFNVLVKVVAEALNKDIYLNTRF